MSPNICPVIPKSGMYFGLDQHALSKNCVKLLRK